MGTSSGPIWHQIRLLSRTAGQGATSPNPEASDLGRGRQQRAAGGDGESGRDQARDLKPSGVWIFVGALFMLCKKAEAVLVREALCAGCGGAGDVSWEPCWPRP